jgi:hypothetical protein
MIEINLVPDVKQELIKAQRVRSAVISVAIIFGIVSIGVVVALALWIYIVQATRGGIVDSTISEQSKKLSSVEDVSNTLTIQNQLSKLSQMHDNKAIDSRLFDVLTTITPPEPNNFRLTSLSLDSATKTITLDGQAPAGFPAYEVIKKTIASTKFEYTEGGEKKSVPLATQISDGDRNLGEDANGAVVLRFTVSFTYSELLFSRAAQNAVIVAPTKSNVTDSFVGIPNSLFTVKANTTQGGK